jgi:hypothetical protein
MKKLALASLLGICNLFLVTSAKAVCPVCTVAVAGGLVITREFGIDDVISGLWVGALILSTSFWMADWLHKKGVKIKISVLDFALAVLFYLITLVPLYFTNVIGHPYNTLLGFDKLIVGTVFGSVIFLAAVALDKYVRKINGRQLFIYQKVVFPITALVIMSLILFFALPK